METENGFIDFKSGESAVVGGIADSDDDQHDKVVDGEAVEPNIPPTEGDEEGLRKLVVPVMEGSISSSCGSQRSKFRLCVEMSIKNKTGKEGLEEEDKCTNVDPVIVMVDYPNDVVVAVNAKIHRFDRDLSSPDEVDEGKIKHGWSNDCEVSTTDQNENKVLDSTFVKVPLSSTMISPIVEEIETSIVVQTSCNNNSKEPTDTEVKGTRKSSSGNATLYHTVLGDSDGTVGFGNISAITKSKVDNENYEKKPEHSLPINIVNLGKNPSQKLNASAKLFQQSEEEVTPAEKLVKALHILARYRGVWGIYEDEEYIVNHLSSLNRLLTITDKATVYKTCKEEDYLELRGLISYFTLESRFVIRLELLQTFTLLSKKSQTISSFIFESEVPIVLAKEIENGDFTSEEMSAYASYLLQMLSAKELTEMQCETIGKTFYSSLCRMIKNAAKKRFTAISEILFELLLQYHEQLADEHETDLKWQSLILAADDRSVIKYIKQKLTDILLKNVSLGPRSKKNQNENLGHRMQQVFGFFSDMIVCNATRDLFPDAELDVILVSSIHILEDEYFTNFRGEILKAIHRILREIHTEPSGLDKLERLVISLLNEEQGSGDHDRFNRSVLKKIYKIIRVSYT